MGSPTKPAAADAPAAAGASAAADSDSESDGLPAPPPPPPEGTVGPVGGSQGAASAAAGGAAAAAGAEELALAGTEGLEAIAAAFQFVQAGRFTVTLSHGDEIYKPDKRGQSSKIDAYVKFEVGRGSARPVRAKSSTIKNTGSTPSWADEEVQLDLMDPLSLVQEGNVVLNYEVWDRNMFADTKLGEGSVSVLRFFAAGAKNPRGEGMRHWLPLTLTPSGRRGGQAQRPQPAGKLLATLRFQPARPGLLVVTTFSAQNLRNMDMFSQQDPYVALELEDQVARGSTVPRGGTEPNFREEELEIRVTRQNWSKPLRVALYDEDPGRDDFIGDCLLGLLALTSLAPGGEGAVENTMQLQAGGKAAGQIHLGFRFYPAGELRLEVTEGRRLASRETVGQMDPYVTITLGGSRHPVTLRTKTDSRAGSDPVWNEVLTFDVVSEHEARIEVWDYDVFSADDVVGGATMSLLPVFKAGVRDHWFRLALRSQWGRVEAAGEVYIKADFTGPPGVRFPQRQPDMDSFDESERVARSGERVKDLVAKTSGGAGDGTGRDPTTGRASTDAPPSSGGEFDDQEVVDAFAFLDLDGNQHLSAAELRHVLVCMGELITDEEIDEMVRMVDADGDGQISFDEFRTLAMHPDPASAEFDLLVRGGDKEPADVATRAIEDRTAASGAGGRAPPPPPSGPGAALAAVGNRSDDVAREKLAREKRKNYLQRFASDQRLRVADLQRAWEKLLADRPMPAGGAAAMAAAGWSDLVSFQDMCDVFAAEPTGEARQLYNVFVDPDLGRVPLRRLLLALCSFAGADRSTRVNLCFYLFDDDKSGTIDEDELREILRANHLASDASQIESKARHVLAQADKDGDGQIDMDEFVVLASKMPNLLFPQLADG
ncbi:hypothetical protein FNF27_02389 [Cafeteria roenbergensis]|uniref:Uncharacterized protein n=1 Tax=Cafeteria roenbergensis TaxID=33653 RepID=A0A5A8EH15_CAFRO|nr:hypothetical protein FNF27_02389 [Cafeteria roenbergensis]